MESIKTNISAYNIIFCYLLPLFLLSDCFRSLCKALTRSILYFSLLYPEHIYVIWCECGGKSVAKVAWLLSFCLCLSIWRSLFLALSFPPYFVVTLSRAFSVPIFFITSLLSCCFYPPDIFFFLPARFASNIPLSFYSSALQTEWLCMQWFAGEANCKLEVKASSISDFHLDLKLHFILYIAELWFTCVIIVASLGGKWFPKSIPFPSAREKNAIHFSNSF